MEVRTISRAASAGGFIARSLALFLPALMAASTAAAAVLSTTDPVAIAAFQSGRTVLGFDELVVPGGGACYIPLDPNQYAAQGILISAQANGSEQTHVAQLPGCGHFGPTQSLPNIIGGGTGPGSIGWRESVRFDFPVPTSAIGAHSDLSGSNTTLTAYDASGVVIASVSGDQGYFLGIAEPGIAYAIWNWNYDQAVAGFSLDNVTFGTIPTGVVDREPTPSLARVEVVPNPFDSEMSVRFNLPAPERVRVGVYDVRGQRVASLIDAQYPAGDGVVGWNARDDRGREVASGVYFVRVDLPGGTISRRVVRIR